ncbi:MAG TPA: benzoate-CoA ligase family protein [Spirochaetia bacterium]|nr:benzoate-CoA ligase family protein [Spirochaetia bacterium]
MVDYHVPDKFNIASFLLDRHIKEGRGGKVAVYYEDRTFTYGELSEMADKLGNSLRDLGVEQENRVIICLPDCPEFLAGYFGTMKIGAVPVPVSTMALPADYLYYLNDSRAKVLIVTARLAPVIDELRDRLDYLKHVIVVGPYDRHLSFETLLQTVSPSLEAVATSRDDMAFWLYSSGTTGTPKGVVHLHHDLLHFMPPHCNQVVALTQDDIVFSTSKLFFSYGRNNSLDSTFLHGASVVLNPSLSTPDKIFAVIEKYRPTLFYSVPSSYWAMLNYLEQNSCLFDLSSIRFCVSAGEALPPVIFERWKGKFGLEILDGIGSTDVGAIYLSNRPGQVKPGSSGKLLSGFEGKLLDDEGCIVPQGEIGTMWINNDGCTAGYWNKHEKTRTSLNGVWFNTGDQFSQDEDGYFWYAGRIDDMLKPGGLWLSPLEIENLLLEHPGVQEVAVVGVQNEPGLEKPVAFVVLREGFPPAESMEQQIQEFVRARVAGYKCPRKVLFVAELPRTASGKVQRFRLRDVLRTDV